MNRSFNEKLSEWLKLAETIHNLSNTLSGYYFADEQGWLKPEDIAEMEKQKNIKDTGNERAQAILKSMQSEFPEEWNFFLSSMIDALLELKGILENEEKTKQSFTHISLPDLIRTLTEIRDTGRSQYCIYWAVTVGKKFIEEYQPAEKDS